MITIPEIRTGPVVKHYVNDEVHIIGKQSRKPCATITFVAVGDNGERILDAPVATFVLKGSAFNTWYSGWDGEKSLYSKILELVAAENSEISMSGVDLGRIGGSSNISIPSQIEEVINAT